MIFSDITTKTGVLQQIEQMVYGDDGYGQITGNTNRLYNWTNRVNRAYENTWLLFLTADGRWQIDDNNATDFPIATQALVANQSDYSFGVDMIEIVRVEILDQNGNYQKIYPIDESQINQSLTEFMKTAGMPRYYDKIGNSLFLYPKPGTGSVTLAAGLKVTYKRPVNNFVYTDTTKVPGFSSIFHEILPKKAVLSYFIDRQDDRVGNLGGDVQKIEAQIKEFVGNRNKDEITRIRVGDYTKEME